VNAPEPTLQRRPSRVLHRAGNVRDLLHLAAHPAVDAIEADVWVVHGHLIAHHERPVGRWLLGARGVARGRDRVPLEVILEAVKGRSEFIVDLRSWIGDPAPDLARVLTTSLDDFSHITVTCESWVVADRLREWIPGLRVAYSIRSERQLARFMSEVDTGLRPVTPATVRHTLLDSAGAIEAIRERAGRVGAWTVDDVERALVLKDWGVDQLVSNNLQVLNAI
jgi:hypothetical protein